MPTSGILTVFWSHYRRASERLYGPSEGRSPDGDEFVLAGRVHLVCRGFRGRVPRSVEHRRGFRGRVPRSVGHCRDFRGRVPRSVDHCRSFQGRVPRSVDHCRSFRGRVPRSVDHCRSVGGRRGGGSGRPPPSRPAERDYFFMRRTQWADVGAPTLLSL